MLADANKISGNESSATLLEVKGLRIEGLSEKGWQEIVCGVDLKLKRGAVSYTHLTLPTRDLV